MVIKLIDTLIGQHIHSKIYMSKEANQTFALCGELVMRVDEWQTLTVALLLGADQMNGHFQVETPNSEMIIGEMIIGDLSERDV